MKRKIYDIIEGPSAGTSTLNRYFDFFIASLIILNVAAIAIETLPTLNEEQRNILNSFETFSLIIFTIEYLLRIYVSDIRFHSRNNFRSALKFALSPLGLIDLFAILPFWIPFFLPIDLRFIRLLRLFRFLRVFKMARYSRALKLILDVFRDKKTELGMTFFIAFILLVIASFLMYFTENEEQPEVFNNIFSSFWWALSTLTSVGYGDIYPVTTLGKIISALVSLLGIGIVAIPTGIISSGFITRIDYKKTSKPSKPAKTDVSGFRDRNRKRMPVRYTSSKS